MCLGDRTSCSKRAAAGSLVLIDDRLRAAGERSRRDRRHGAELVIYFEAVNRQLHMAGFAEFALIRQAKTSSVMTAWQTYRACFARRMETQDKAARTGLTCSATQLGRWR